MSSQVSIIIPCFNQARFLPDTLECLLSQTYKDWECLIINDGSTDNTIDIAQEYIARDHRFRLISKQNGGLSSARNRGIKESKGRWLQFLDSDDIILPEKLEKQLILLSNAPGPALSFCDYYFCGEHDVHDRISKGKDYEHPRFVLDHPILDLAVRWESKLSIPAHCFLFDSLLFTHNKIFFDEDLPNHEDWDCWMRVFSLNPHIYPVEEELAVYRQHSNSMATNKKAMWLGFEMAINKQIKIHRDSRQLNLALKQKLTAIHLDYFGHPRPFSKKSLPTPRAASSLLGLFIRQYHKRTPWPIQRAIKALFIPRNR